MLVHYFVEKWEQGHIEITDEQYEEYTNITNPQRRIDYVCEIANVSTIGVGDIVEAVLRKIEPKEQQ